MKNQAHLILVFLAILLFISCGPIHRNRLYLPASQDNISRLRQKNDIDISYNQKIPRLEKDNIDYRNIQISYSPIKHIGLSVGNSTLKSHNHRSEMNFSNAAIGGYYFFQKKEIIRKNGLQTRSTATMPIGTLIDFYGGMEIGSVNNYFRTVSTQNQFNLIELNSNIQLRKYFLRGGFHFQNKLIGFSTIFKGGRYYFEEGVINLEGESSNIFLHEFLLISRFPSGNYLESTLKLFVGKENIQGYIGITRLDTFHNLNIGEKNNLINFGLSVDIDNFYRGFRRIRKNKN